MIKFPFINMQEMNLDWLLQQVKKILDFLPINSGVTGDVLQRGTDGATWQPISAVSMDIHGLYSSTADGADEIPIYDSFLQGNYKITVQDIIDNAPVQSVNGQTGDVIVGGAVDSVNGQTGTVVLDKTDIGLGNVDDVQQYSASNPPPYPVTSVNGQTGAVIVSGGGAVDSVNGYTGTVVLGKSDIGLGNVDNVQQYSASNPPPYPVTSVNGQTGAVTVSGTGIDILGGTAGSFSVASHAGIGQISDINNLNYRLSADKKWIIIYGWFTVTFNTTGDYTLIDLGNITLNTTGTTAYYYHGGVNLYSSAGQLNLSASKDSSILRLANNTLRLTLQDPATTGTFTAIINPTMIQLD